MFDIKVYLVYTEPMKIEYDGGTIGTAAHPTDPNLIIVWSFRRDTLMEVVSSLELAGVAEGLDFNDLFVAHDHARGCYEMHLDRATFALWFQFEVLNYLHVASENIHV